ncbi:4a-hydroxytetrahydrobiopterin dehydratase [Aquabacterium sp. A3]|uniref:4a-hydroxytetrahydrobiopterin dehydratase n=1 Tax=Aquabacterium sp. A3 TaxID=3132829 RepID=UPI00311A3773
MSTQPLAQQHCSHQSGPALSADALPALLAELPGWRVEGAGAQAVLTRTVECKDFHHTMAFVNAVAWVAHQQDHHPDMLVGYKTCTLRWSTHSVGGLSINDFICAARVDALAQ